MCTVHADHKQTGLFISIVRKYKVRLYVTIQSKWCLYCGTRVVFDTMVDARCASDEEAHPHITMVDRVKARGRVSESCDLVTRNDEGREGLKSSS